MSTIAHTHGWSTMVDGDYAGCTLPQALFKDPNWFFRACLRGAFEDDLLTEAEELYEKSTHIKIPQGRSGKKRLAEYQFKAGSVQYWNLTLVHPGARHTIEYSFRRKEVIDLRMTWNSNLYTRHAGKRLLKDVKKILFRSESYRMTKRRCEEFFSDEENFDLTASTENVESSESDDDETSAGQL